MLLSIFHFNELTPAQLYEILQLRQLVFVVEQNCVYLDCDDNDQRAMHICLSEEESLIAYTRILAPGTSYESYCSIGRVVNHPDHRKKGLGKEIMKASIAFCRKTFPEHSIKISAQIYLDDFYTSLGFLSTGEEYLEDGIPHQAMILK